MTKTLRIGIDIGGTFIKGAVCDDSARVLHERMIATEAGGGFEHVLCRIVDLVEALITAAAIPRERFVGVGVGAPGPMSHEHGIIYEAPNLPGWRNVPLRERLSARLNKMPVTLENDANAAAFGEFSAGAGRGGHSLVLLTLGTGVGGGVILKGQLWRGAHDTAGEIGHIVVVPAGRPCTCGQRGCLERYASATAVAQRCSEALAAGRRSLLQPPIDAQAVCVAMQAGDPVALEVWDECCRTLALAMISVHHLLNPDRIVLAGGLSNAGDWLLRPVERYFRQMTWKIAPDLPQIRLATLGSNAGMIGAAMLATAQKAPA